MPPRGWLAAAIVVVSACTTGSGEPTSPAAGSSTGASAEASPTLAQPALFEARHMNGVRDGDTVYAVAISGTMLIGVGNSWQRLGGGGAWTSADGVHWTLAPNLPETAGGGPGQGTALYDVVAAPSGWVAVGGWYDIDFGTPRIWYSGDGESWANVLGPNDPVEASGGSVHAVATGSSGFVAIGAVCPVSEFPQCHPRTWTSADGQSWAEHESVSMEGASLIDIVNGDGRLVAVGAREGRATSFTSTDGQNWEESAPQADLERASLFTVAFADGMYIGGGVTNYPSVTGPADPAIWQSVDGLHWTLVMNGSRPHTIEQILAGPDGFVAVGGLFPSAEWSYDPAHPSPPADTVEIWTSADGISWLGPTATYHADGLVSMASGVLLPGGEVLMPAQITDETHPTWPYSPVVLTGMPHMRE